MGSGSSRATFRHEVLQRFSVKPWQPALLSKPMSGFLIAILCVVVLTLIGVVTTTLQFPSRERARGVLVPVDGWVRVTATTYATVRRRHVDPGTSVRAGDVLFELASGRGMTSGMSIGQSLLSDLKERQTALKARLAASASKFEHDRKAQGAASESLQRQIEKLRIEVDAHGRRLGIANQRLQSGQALSDRGGLSGFALLDLADEVESRTATLALKERALAVALADLEASKARLAGLSKREDQEVAVIRGETHSLAMERTRILGNEMAKILAPRAGHASSIMANVGDWITPGDVLLDILPEGSLYKAQLSVGSSGIGNLAVGQEVRLLLDAFPFEHHGVQHGRVANISETTVGPWRGPLGVTPEVERARFVVDVVFPQGFDLDEESQRSLRPGMTVEADLVREYRTLADWVLGSFRRASERI